MGTVLALENLNFSYGNAEVLSKVSFMVEGGDYVGLAGPNGAGKTTLVKVVLGLLKNFSGRVELFGKPVQQFHEWNRVGFLPQRVNVFNALFPATVKEVVGLGLLSQKGFPKKFGPEDDARIEETLAVMDIEPLKNRLAGDLSGGQQQRVFLARALVSNPELLILDEPGTALDPQSSKNFYDLIRKLNRERGLTVIIITHDTGQIGEYADKLLYLDKKLVFYGRLKDFCESEQMTDYFGHFSQHLICHQHRGA
jgi:zinc transport system ATP-binding protein